MNERSTRSDCQCGSGKSYANCCGLYDGRLWNEEAHGRIEGSFKNPEMARFVAGLPTCEFNGVGLPPGLLVQKLGHKYKLKDIARRMVSTPEAVDAAVKTDAGQKKLIAGRVTGIVDPGNMSNRVIELVRKAYAKEIEPFFNCKLRSLETPQILRYTQGSHYRPHADSDVLDHETGAWKKVKDRDYSLLIYLDDEYEGGELIFPNFDFRLRPEAGMLVAFPSDYRYLHGAMPVLSGVRHAIVSWCAVEAG